MREYKVGYSTMRSKPRAIERILHMARFPNPVWIGPKQMSEEVAVSAKVGMRTS
jgi:hypothetical protein